eukprot:g23958.t1
MRVFQNCQVRPIANQMQTQDNSFAQEAENLIHTSMLSCQNVCRILYIWHLVIGLLCLFGRDPLGLDYAKDTYGTGFVKTLGMQFLALSLLFMGISHTPEGRHYLLRYYGVAVVLMVPVAFFAGLHYRYDVSSEVKIGVTVYAQMAIHGIIAVLCFTSVEPPAKKRA